MSTSRCSISTDTVGATSASPLWKLHESPSKPPAVAMPKNGPPMPVLLRDCRVGPIETTGVGRGGPAQTEVFHAGPLADSFELVPFG
jgi:hypothetical protein